MPVFVSEYVWLSGWNGPAAGPWVEKSVSGRSWELLVGARMTTSQAIWEASRRSYGSPRVWGQLRRYGFRVAR